MKKRKVRRRHRELSERAKLERTLGHKLLTGEIPVVPPRQIHRCPVPRSHKDYESLCKDYDEGKITYDEVLAKVGESLSKPKPPAEQPEKEVKKDEGL